VTNLLNDFTFVNKLKLYFVISGGNGMNYASFKVELPINKPLNTERGKP